MRTPQLIRMDRASLDGLPPRPAVPAGLSIHTYSDSLFEPWLSLLEACFPENGQLPRERWRERVVSDSRFLRDGWFLVHDDRSGPYVATAYSWAEGPEHPGLGRVEWVGVLPERRGQGLGRLVMSLVLHYLADSGFSRATLDTEAFRVPAVALYLSLGFVPVPRNSDEHAVWAEVVAQASHRRTSDA